MTFTAETTNGPITGHEGGDPAGPAVLLLHGVTDYMEMLAPELDGWRAIYYQQRGHAPSATEGPFTVSRNVADAIAVMEALADGFADSLKLVTAPAVVLAGGGSPMPASQSEQTAALLPNSTYRVVPGAGHLIWYEAPGVVAEALATFR
jgi:pimeloyl-ACP methyl ester carboxylesterase